MSPQTVLLLTMTLVLAGAWFTTFIGLYAVFGAFSVGLVLPPASAQASPDQLGKDPLPAPKAAADLVSPTMDGISQMLVPMFFACSGLNTRFALLGNPRVLLFSLAAIVVAVPGKGGACWLAARLAGESRPVSARIGALMNARGLMQLIALNVALQAGIASQDLFTSLVLVALVTTIMGSPILGPLDRRDRAAAPASALPLELG